MEAKKRPARFRLLLKRFVMGVLIIVGLFVFLSYLPSFYLMAIDSLTPTSIRDSILSDETCRPPCWHGLIVGESTLEDVENFLQTSNRIPAWSIQRYPEDNYGSAIQWYRPLRREAGSFWFDTRQILQQVNLRLVNTLAIQDIIAIYGEPIFTVVWIDYANHAPIQQRGFGRVELYYPAYGMIITSELDYEYGEENFTIPLNPTASEIRFYASAANLDEFFRDVYPFSSYAYAEDILAGFRYVLGWIGYGVTVHVSTTDNSITIEPAER